MFSTSTIVEFGNIRILKLKLLKLKFVLAKKIKICFIQLKEELKVFKFCFVFPDILFSCETNSFIFSIIYFLLRLRKHVAGVLVQ